MADKRERRSYTKAFRRRVVAEIFEPGASVAAVAREHGINANMLFGWRKDPRWMPRSAKMQADVAFLPVEVADEGEVPRLSIGAIDPGPATLAPSCDAHPLEPAMPQAGSADAPSSAVTKLELTLRGGRQLSLEGTFRLGEIAALARKLDEA